MKIKVDVKYVVFAVLLVLIYLAVFLWPASQDNLSLDPEKVGDEYWRWGTYQFAHLDWGHLIQNLITLGLVSSMAMELKSKFKFFSATYLIAGFVAILPLWIFSPFVALGASVAIYSSFGYFSPKTKDFRLKVWLVLTGITAFIFFSPILSLVQGRGDIQFEWMQSLAHFSGFVFGLGGFYFFKQIDRYLIKRKQFILRRS